MNLQCVTSCGSNGRFAVQNAGTDVLSVSPDGRVQVGSATTNSTLNLLQLDSYDGSAAAEVAAQACSTTVNQGALYYNTTMGSLRGCMGASGWVDVSNPDTLGLLTFGVIPSSGGVSNSYDLPSLSQPAISGPCKVSWASATTVNIQQCVAYSGGRRVTVAAVTGMSVAGTLTNANSWGHICLTGTNGAPTLSAGSSSETANLPTWNIASPVLCIADIKMTTSGGTSISKIYDTRTFSSTNKEPVNTSSAVALGMLVDAGASGAMTPAASGSKKLYGAVIVADSSTPSSAGAPNAIVSTMGATWVKAASGSAGEFVIANSAGYATTIGAIPNNSFYYSAGNTRTSYTAPAANVACSSITTCGGSLYINLVVR